ncbi:MAG: 6-phosphofructokinase [Candidatus Desulfovibrio kirbyi]|uniref:6-phosphofructokinase n=1 Tax=Candidatus Desulfovibrio kirbyi TaxID=2696086 RepID=A0A6L2R608_9BACT|nr:MAG: 6-phosphofructokinase [Candidatus Desulfovibrio kirbyi]
MRKLYVAMVGLPARGKSTLARRIREGLIAEGINAAIFNNGDMRRSLVGAESTEPDFYNPTNHQGRDIREMICRHNMNDAKDWLAKNGDIAILDATNASRARRALIESTLNDHPVLFVECLNEDPVLLEACIKQKTTLPEYAGYAYEDALASFMKRISYYETLYEPLNDERFCLRVDAPANRILNECPCEESPYYPAIREIAVSVWVHSLCLVRHGQTEFNVQGRIGGDPTLTDRGYAQAEALANHMQGREINWVFTSTRVRSHQTAAPLLANRPDTTVMALKEFDELWAGDCEGMLYSDIRKHMPDVTAGRNANKFGYAYPNGESYAVLCERVQRGLRRALFLAGNTPLLIVGHQAVNRVLITLFLRQREEDVPYIYIPQNQYFQISLTPRRKIFERIPYQE